MSHHKTWFPLIVIALSALLAVFIYSVFRERIVNSVSQTPVTIEAYQAAVAEEMSGLVAQLEALDSSADRLARLASAREALLQLRVPGSQKDLHLEMVMILTEWMTGEQGDAEALADAKSRWDILVAQHRFLSGASAL